MKEPDALFHKMKYCGALKNRLAVIACLTLSLVAIVGNVVTQKAAESSAGNWTDAFPVEEFSSTGANPYFILKPGYFLILEGTEDGRRMQLTITVLHETKMVNGVESRVVEEREKSIR